MIPPLLEKRYKSNTIWKDIPVSFCLGQGHMIFWTIRMKYLEKRYELLTLEMEARGFNPDRTLVLDTSLSKTLPRTYCDWAYSSYDERLIVTRIREKIFEKINWYRFYGKPITNEWVDNNYFVR
jgi:hypothetical protein